MNTNARETRKNIILQNIEPPAESRQFYYDRSFDAGRISGETRKIFSYNVDGKVE